MAVEGGKQEGGIGEERFVGTKRPSEIRGMFHDISPTYDFLNHLLSLNIDRRWRRFVARKVMTGNPARVLDVCAGTGDLAIELTNEARRCGFATKVTASDFTPSMMRRGKNKFEQMEGGDEIPRAMVADTMQLPFSTGSFDLATVAFGIRNVTDVSTGLAEMARVCRPGGRVAVLEFSQPRNRVIAWCYNRYFFGVLPWVGRLISGSRAYTYLPKSVAKFPDGDEFSRLLRQATGGEVTRHPLTFGIATLYISIVSAR